METNEDRWDRWHLRIITVRYINILALNATKRMCNCFLYSSDTSFMFFVCYLYSVSLIFFVSSIIEQGHFQDFEKWFESRGWYVFIITNF